MTRVLSFADSGAAPRVVDIGSLLGRPFQALISWTVGGGIGGRLFVSVATGARVAIVARELQVDGLNLHASDNEVVALVGDGFATTRNVWEHELEAAPTNQNIPIPPCAHSVRLNASDPAATGKVQLWNGNGTLLVEVPIASIPDSGLLIGGASEVHVTCSHACRVAFDLTI